MTLHDCQGCGLTHEGEVMEAPEPETEVVERTVDADVEIARIGAERDVKVAKISAGVADDELTARVAEMEGQIRGMREVLDRIAPPAPEPEPEDDPEPIVIEAPEAEAEAEPEMPPRDERDDEPSAPRKRRGLGAW